MPHRTLTLRELNRTHLQRQHLLTRADLGVRDMLRALVGLQAQVTKDPYLALWSRIEGFTHDQLGDLLLDREAVRASLMRGTIHLVTADDYRMLFPATYSLHRRALPGLAYGKQVPREAYDPILASTHAFLTNNPSTLKDVADHLAEAYPDIDRRALGQVGRFLLPLVQIPPRGVWGQSHTATWALASEWLGVPIAEAVGPPDEMIRRYLAAFGPASLADMSSWSGVTNLKGSIVTMGDEMELYQDESGTVLYDLAGMEFTDPAIPAPARFLPGFDNALLGHKDRRRIISEEHRRMIGTQNGMFASTFLVDGFVAGIWSATTEAIALTPFRPFTRHQQQEIEAEATRLAPFWTSSELPVRWAQT